MRVARQPARWSAPTVVALTVVSVALSSGVRAARASGSGAESESADPVADPMLAPVAVAADSTIDEPRTLEDCLALAALQNPGLRAAFERWKADLERVPQVGAYPDPRFNFAYYIREVETRVGPQRARFNLAQTFPWFGKLGLKEDVAFEASEASHRRYDAAKLRLFYEVKDAYNEYYYLGRAIEITRRNLQLLIDLEQVARIRYRTAAAGQPDVIKAQVEMGRIEDRLAALEDLRDPLVARLNALMNRPVESPLSWPEHIVWGPMIATDAEILTWTREENPDLLALTHEVRAREKAVELSGKDFYPDFTFGLDYIATDPALDPLTPDSGKDPIIATVSINVPIWRGSYRAAEREAEARLRTSLHARDDRTKVLESTVKKVLFDCRDAERKVQLYQHTLIPKGEQSLESAQTAFMAGHADFLDVIDAQRVLLEFELAFDRARATHAQRVAELEMYAGRAIPVAEVDQ